MDSTHLKSALFFVIQRLSFCLLVWSTGLKIGQRQHGSFGALFSFGQFGSVLVRLHIDLLLNDNVKNSELNSCGFCVTGNAGSLRIPIEGQLVYDTMSKTADLCLSPNMCPPCVYDALCHINNLRPTVATTGTPWSTDASSSATTPTTTPTPTPTTSPSTEEATAAEATTETSSQTPTEEPSTSASTPATSSSATEITEATEATETTPNGSTEPTPTVTMTTSTVGGGVGTNEGRM